MPKLALCFISQNPEKLFFEYYFIQTKGRGFFQKLFGSKKEFTVEILAHYDIRLNVENGEIKSNLVQNFADVISYYQNTKDTIYTNIYLDNDAFFTASFDLPKLSGKALSDTFNDELHSRYASILKNFEYKSSQELSENKGYTYNLLFYNANSYKQILDLFAELKISIDKSYYYPSIFNSYFTKPDNVDKNVLIFQFYHEYTKAILGVKGETKNCRFVEFGLDDVNKAITETCEVEAKAAEQYRHDNRRKRIVIQTITRSCKRLINEVMYSVVYTAGLTDLDKIVLASEDGGAIDLMPPFQRNFNGITSVYANSKKDQIGALIDIALEKNKSLVELPLKVKSNEK